MNYVKAIFQRLSAQNLPSPVFVYEFVDSISHDDNRYTKSLVFWLCILVGASRGWLIQTTVNSEETHERLNHFSVHDYRVLVWPFGEYLQALKVSVSSLHSLVWFHGISTIVDYLMPNPLYINILNIYDLVWFGLFCFFLFFVFWHINHCGLLNTKSSPYKYIQYTWFGLVLFVFIAHQPLSVIWCQILFIQIYSIYMIWFGLLLGHINHCRLFNAKFS